MRRTPKDQLEALRRYRVRPGPEVGIGVEVERARKGFQKRRRATGGLDSVWETVVPSALAEHARIERLTPGGVLTIRVRDSSALAQADEWLKTGGLERLRAGCSVTLRRIRLELGEIQ